MSNFLYIIRKKFIGIPGYGDTPKSTPNDTPCTRKILTSILFEWVCKILDYISTKLVQSHSLMLTHLHMYSVIIVKIFQRLIQYYPISRFSRRKRGKGTIFSLHMIHVITLSFLSLTCYYVNTTRSDVQLLLKKVQVTTS